jgi:hypothetical protein
MSARFGRAWIVAVCTGFEPHLPFSRNSAKGNALSRMYPPGTRATWTDPPAAFLSRTLTVVPR